MWSEIVEYAYDNLTLSFIWIERNGLLPSIRKNPPPLSSGKILYYLLCSILINAFGNSLTVSLNMGSSMWTAAAVNSSHFFAIPLSDAMLCFAFFAIFANIVMTKRIKWRMLLGNFVFMFPFSYLVRFFTDTLVAVGLPQLPFVIKLALDCIGILFIAIGVSIYQRVNVMIHPIDELMNNVRFLYCKGNARIGMWVSFIPPISVIVLLYVLSGQLYAVHLGTIVALLFQGTWIGMADKVVFPSLHHYFR